MEDTEHHFSATTIVSCSYGFIDYSLHVVDDHNAELF